ncbi:Queuine tRNA-ribosyltransferase-like protein [Neolecta irregularis DAH-3]|uniref:Queuine tRNA-ribosyltransferase accessory subunit 2 n=1 Tax=Neolecta irregularis (strain DAH-3) TaxID=1198029 RepID=A0A1U7LP62_NEOID|nr:Queuine tRNA-ribosyltransferase-like protein [Neolecta irregularis DAH-3]|eukprot:OLL24445.1 Queuine tRNA-ribosyltransferase-like protein [Neolecta irregularis DAH-3]
MSANTERTFIAVKPDGVQRCLVGEIIGRFEKRGYKLVALKMITPSKDLLQKHYADLSTKSFFNGLIQYMLSGPVVAMVWEGLKANFWVPLTLSILHQEPSAVIMPLMSVEMSAMEATVLKMQRRKLRSGSRRKKFLLMPFLNPNGFTNKHDTCTNRISFKKISLKIFCRDILDILHYTSTLKLHDHMDKLLPFEILKPGSLSRCRTGQLHFMREKTIIKTPTFIPSSSRGAIPHITPDILQKHTNVSAIYYGLEDFIERFPQKPPCFQRPLRDFVALQDDKVVLLGPRRSKPIPTPTNTNHFIGVTTSEGVRKLSLSDYIDAAVQLKPDLVVALADIPQKNPGGNRVNNVLLRSELWIQKLADANINIPILAVFPPNLPDISCQKYSAFLASFEENFSGMAIFEGGDLQWLSESTRLKPQFLIPWSKNPHEILSLVAQGVDVFTADFVLAATDAGVALTFDLLDENCTVLPLSQDMWDTSQEFDTRPINSSCSCYTCSKFQRCYIRHLLYAKEMFGWTLLQIHNLKVLSKFFNDIRESITNGCFETLAASFNRRYEREIPVTAGKGPRRGYQKEGEDSETPSSQDFETTSARNSETICRNLETSSPSQNFHIPAKQDNITPPIEQLQTSEYWNTKYKPDSIPFDWFLKYDQIKDFIIPFLTKNSRILQLGCGNSELSGNLYDDGFQNIVNVDFSNTLISEMIQRYKNKPMEWTVADARELRYSGEFDVIIDKGCLDAMISYTGSVWDPPEYVTENCRKEIDGVMRGLKVNGVFIYITYAQPHFRLRYLERVEWTCQVHKLGGGMGTFEYFGYVCKKG